MPSKEDREGSHERAGSLRNSYSFMEKFLPSARSSGSYEQFVDETAQSLQLDLKKGSPDAEPDERSPIAQHQDTYVPPQEYLSIETASPTRSNTAATLASAPLHKSLQQLAELPAVHTSPEPAATTGRTQVEREYSVRPSVTEPQVRAAETIGPVDAFPGLNSRDNQLFEVDINAPAAEQLSPAKEDLLPMNTPLGDFLISSSPDRSPSKRLDRKLSHSAYSVKVPLNPRRSSDTGLHRAGKHMHKPSDPLVFSKQIQARIESLGTDLPMGQQIVLWIGIVLDFVAKGSLVFELYRFGHRHHWLWFAFTTLFFLVSSLVVAVYWWTHYPGAIADQVVETSPVTASQADANKKYRRIMHVGLVCAILQLGTAFAAFRALRVGPMRQRLAAMDLRGMRLMDSVFLTLSVCVLQVYVGMRCTQSERACLAHRGFDLMLCAGAVASLLSSTLSFVSFEYNDQRLRHDKYAHGYQVVLFFMYRVLELGARICLLALFANVFEAWVYAAVAIHVGLVLFCLRFSPVPHQKKIWDKVMATVPYQLNLGKWRPTIRLPRADDVKLLVCCLAWPPSCYVSDATDKNGKFWWRGRMVGRRSGCEIRLNERLIAFPIYTFVTASETALMLGLIWASLPHWSHRYFGTTAVLQALWALFGMLWCTSAAMLETTGHTDMLDSAIAVKDSQLAQQCDVTLPDGQLDSEARLAISMSLQDPCIPPLGPSPLQMGGMDQKPKELLVTPRRNSSDYCRTNSYTDGFVLRGRPSDIGLLAQNIDSAQPDVEMTGN